MSSTRTCGVKPHPSIPGRGRPATGRGRRALRLVGWNALFLVLGLTLIGVVGEMYLRLRVPFFENDAPRAWFPTVGRTFTPNTEVRRTNRLDFWVESRTNSLGFLDREPIGLERAAASCHIAMIGDSYVEALQVPTRNCAIWTSRPRRSVSPPPARSTNWRTTTNSRGLSGPPCWCSSSSTTTSSKMRQSCTGCTTEWTRTDSPRFPRREARTGPSRCDRPIPLFRSPGWPPWPRLLRPGIRASRTA